MRHIHHHGSDPSAVPVEISARVLSGLWFELHRQGGCGAGEIRLSDAFADRSALEIGDWISVSDGVGERWYLGRIESREATGPAGVVCRLEGMGVELGEVFPGGFGADADGVPPHRYSTGDLFPDDPDHAAETVTAVSEPIDVVRALASDLIAPATHITHDPTRITASPDPELLASLKFRGEESVRSILKELAVRSGTIDGAACWGVDETGTFFFTPAPDAEPIEVREGVDLLRLEEDRGREAIFNRLLLTGGYVYHEPIAAGSPNRIASRWRGNYLQPASRDRYGERRIKLWIPWIRSDEDAQGFATGFFRIYADPTDRITVELDGIAGPIRPWVDRLRVLDAAGDEILSGSPETVRVRFDRRPRMTVRLGPPLPHELWPEPPHDERWELPMESIPGYGGAAISLPTDPTGCKIAEIEELEYRFRADTLTFADGDPVPNWTAQIGMGSVSQGEGSRQPTFVATGVNGLPIVRGDGVDDRLTSDPAPPASTSDAYTWFLVLIPRQLSGTEIVMRLGGDDWDQSVSIQNGRLRWSSYTNTTGTADSYAGNRSVTIGNPYVYCLERDAVGGVMRSWQNGVADGSAFLSGQAANYGTDPTLDLFGRSFLGSDTPGQVDLAEVLIFSDKLSTTDRENVERCLAEKYGITVP